MALWTSGSFSQGACFGVSLPYLPPFGCYASPNPDTERKVGVIADKRCLNLHLNWNCGLIISFTPDNHCKLHNDSFVFQEIDERKGTFEGMCLCVTERFRSQPRCWFFSQETWIWQHFELCAQLATNVNFHWERTATYLGQVATDVFLIFTWRKNGATAKLFWSSFPFPDPTLSLRVVWVSVESGRVKHERTGSKLPWSSEN